MTTSLWHRSSRSARAVAARVLGAGPSGSRAPSPLRVARRDHQHRVASARFHAPFC